MLKSRLVSYVRPQRMMGCVACLGRIGAALLFTMHYGIRCAINGCSDLYRALAQPFKMACTLVQGPWHACTHAANSADTLQETTDTVATLPWESGIFGLVSENKHKSHLHVWAELKLQD